MWQYGTNVTLHFRNVLNESSPCHATSCNTLKSVRLDSLLPKLQGINVVFLLSGFLIVSVENRYVPLILFNWYFRGFLSAFLVPCNSLINSKHNVVDWDGVLIHCSLSFMNTSKL